ncbi:MAG TPA: sugar kinase [Steroidobacteraceae bacterium]
MAASGAIVCFGEILLRLSAPPGEMLLQTPAFQLAVGGAEANVAVALARAGAPAAMVSILPDNPLGTGARDALRRYGVDASGIRFAPGRMGLYFLTPGAVLRASDAFYDRAASAFAVAQPDAIDWDVELKGASRLHLSGVTPALNAQTAAAALRAAQSATRLGVPVSFDANYRAKLWASSDSHAPTLLRGLLTEAETAFMDHRDLALVFERPFVAEGAERDSQMAEEAFRTFPRLRRIAFTRRQVQAADRHELIAHLIPREGPPLCSASQALHGIVDRVGAGDAFAAGILYGLWRGLADRQALDYGLASACFKHSVVGDASLATAGDLDAFLAGGLDIRR